MPGAVHTTNIQQPTFSIQIQLRRSLPLPRRSHLALHVEARGSEISELNVTSVCPSVTVTKMRSHCLPSASPPPATAPGNGELETENFARPHMSHYFAFNETLNRLSFRPRLPQPLSKRKLAISYP